MNTKNPVHTLLLSTKQMLPTQRLWSANPFTEYKHTVNYRVGEHIQQRRLMAWILLPLLQSRCTSLLLLLFLVLSFQSDIDCHIMVFHSGESTHFSSPEYFHYVTLSADYISHNRSRRMLMDSKDGWVYWVRFKVAWESWTLLCDAYCLLAAGNSSVVPRHHDRQVCLHETWKS
jgi:hypothetical protein